MTKKVSTLLFKKKNRVTLGPPPKGKWYAALCQSEAAMADPKKNEKYPNRSEDDGQHPQQ